MLQSDISDRRWPREGHTRIPFWLYSDPDIYALEQERIFGGSSYAYVGLECEIPNPGDFKRNQIGDRPVVVVRDHKGSINVVVNRCAHRGVQFCQQHLGSVKEFVCPYHQWSYDLNGELIGIPLRRGYKTQGGMPPDFKIEEHNLRKLKVVVRNGVIFASFDLEMPPLESYLGQNMLRYFDRVFDGRQLKVLGYSRQRIPSNWKLMFENIKDPYHASLLHVFLVSFGLFRMDQPSAVEMDATGMHSVLVNRKAATPAVANTATKEMRSFMGEFQLLDPTLLQPKKEYAGDATVVMQTLWPNLIIQQQSNTLAMRQIVTQGPQAFDLMWTFFGYADDDEDMRMRRLRQANLMGPAGYVSTDDSEVMQFSQAGVSPYPSAAGVIEMGGRETSDQPHTITEVALRAFYKHYRSIIGL